MVNTESTAGCIQNVNEWSSSGSSDHTSYHPNEMEEVKQLVVSEASGSRMTEHRREKVELMKKNWV